MLAVVVVVVVRARRMIRLGMDGIIMVVPSEIQSCKDQIKHKYAVRLSSARLVALVRSNECNDYLCNASYCTCIK